MIMHHIVIRLFAETVPRTIFGKIRKGPDLPVETKDKRTGPIKMECFDKDHNASPRKNKRKLPMTSAHFVPFRYESVLLNAGTVHLFREKSEIDSILAQSETPLASDLSALKGSILAFLAVPIYFTAQNFLDFVAEFHSSILHVRMIQDSLPSRYIALVKFDQPESAQLAYQTLNGKPFVLDQDPSHIVFVGSITFASASIPQWSFPFENEVIELPTCPVCLERMDASVSGLLTIVCQHTFHCSCLSRWQDSSCPVCRFSHKTIAGEDQDVSENECMDCGTSDNLWICLICGNIGCGRYQCGHAFSHYQCSQHLFALELETQRVWDYAGDGYVHRLLQSKSDGKLVELPPQDNGLTEKEKDSIAIEYGHLLSSQLESQRIFYESRLASLNDEHNKQMDRLLLEFQDLKTSYGALQSSHDIERKDWVIKVTGLEKKIAKLTSRIKGLEDEINEERLINKSLTSNQVDQLAQISNLKSKVSEKDVCINELNEQVKDLMFFLEMREKSEKNEDIRGGDLVIEPCAGTQQRRKKDGRRKR